MLKRKIFRKDTLLKRNKIGLYFNSGGMGDYICYLSAVRYIASNYDFNDYKLVVPHYFVEVANNILQSFLNVEIYDYDKIHVLNDCNHSKMIQIFPLNATMTHLLELGFIYFAETNPIPDGYRFYQKLNLSDVKLHGSLKDKEFAVMTPTFTAETRHMRANTFNKIKDYIISLGLKPVFLGNSKMKNVADGSDYVNVDKNINLKNGLNLINKTSVLEAAKIISESKFIVGLDNGLLHLAAMTDAPIIFGYSIASPEQRRPVRESDSPIIDVTVKPEELDCRHCQDKFKLIPDHLFRHCYYKDYKCLDFLDFYKFKSAIDRVYFQDLNLDL